MSYKYAVNAGQRSKKSIFEARPAFRFLQVLSFVAALIVAALGCGQAYAQDEATDENQEPQREIEEVVVSGIRASLQSSLATKRDADFIVDAISAEDIGKFPDKNIAESLQRITGVQIVRNGGEGERVSVRGVSPDLNRVELNGTTVLSSAIGGVRDVDFRDFPSEFVSRLEVVKTPTADMTEGGLGGTVRIYTRKPFDQGGEPFVAGKIETVYDDLADTNDNRMSLFGGTTNSEGTFGVIGGLVYGKRDIYVEQYRSTGWYSPIDFNGDTVANDFLPFLPRPIITNQANDRIGFNGMAQWQITDDFDMYVEATYSQRDYDIESQLLQISLNTGIIDQATTIFDTTNQQIVRLDVNDNPAHSSGLAIDQRSLNDDIDQNIYVIATGGDWEKDAWHLSGRISYTEAEFDQVERGQTLSLRHIPRLSFTFDNTYGVADVDLLGFNILDPAEVDFVNINTRPRTFTQDEFSLQFDADYAMEHSFFSSLEFGIQYREFGTDSVEFRPGVNFDLTANPGLRPMVEAAIAAHAQLNSNAWFSDVGAGLQTTPRFWYYVPRSFSEALGGIPLSAANEQLSARWEISEEVWALYGKANFRMDTKYPISGNFGIRYVETSGESSGIGSITLPPPDNTVINEAVSFSDSNSDIYPSLNLRVDFIPDKLVLRFAAAEVMARPAPNQLAPNLRLQFSTSEGSRGDPALEPYRATEYDLGLEYYLNDTSYLSATLFRKDISSFIQTTQITETYSGQEFTISIPSNTGTGVVINGLELGVQYDFQNLPAPFNGFGVLANYTYSEDEGTPNFNTVTNQQLPFRGLSEDSYNVGVYFENETFSARLSYNWRDDFLLAESGRGGNPNFQEAYGSLDLSTSYEINDFLSVHFDALNLNDVVRVVNAGSTARRDEIEAYGTRYFLGLSFRL